MHYKVTKEYKKGGEILTAQFADINEARLFIRAKLDEDRGLRIKVIYRIYDRIDIMEVYDPDKIETQESGSQGNAKTVAFRPTPLNITPRPPGMPQNWWPEEDEDEDKHK